jgi:DNA-binding NtrC family response regulator
MHRALKILVIDDEKLIRWSFDKNLSEKGYLVETAENGREGLEKMQTFEPHVIFLDHRLPDTTGLELIKKFLQIDQDVHIVFMTAYGTVDMAVQALKSGARDYLSKPFEFDEIYYLLSHLEEEIKTDHVREIRNRKDQYKKTFDTFIGTSKAIQEVISLSRRIAESEANTILILGESGTGKDHLAQAIHLASSRKDQPFVNINCAAIPEMLLESELFGHEKGAFTDAKTRKRGLFELADGGTIYLDEIGEISPELQVKLLKVIEDHIFRRVGGLKNINVDVRIIAATNKNLEEAIEKKAFRQDLYYRLKVFTITIPPLRRRKEDIPLLVKYFVDFYTTKFHKKIDRIVPEVVKIFQQYHWPGNVRELKNVIERSVILAKENEITLDDIPTELKLAIAKNHAEEYQSCLEKIEIPDEGLALDEVEKNLIIKAMIKTNFNQTHAAKLLRISRDKLRYKLKKHGIQF